MNISVYRTYTGEITKGIPGSLSLRNPKTGKMVEVRIFSAKDYVIDTQIIPREIISSKGEKLDLFKDMVADDGSVEVWLRCVAPAQYFGAAQADMYLRAKTATLLEFYQRLYRHLAADDVADRPGCDV